MEPSKPRLLKILGPGLISGAADDDPTAIATYCQAGARFGCGLCWVLPLVYPLMTVVQEVRSSAQAAEALRPIAGAFAFAVFSIGIIGTGLLAIPVLAGSAAYAVGEARKWPVGLARGPLEAKAFYATVAVATLAGMVANFIGLDPIRALYWSAVVNDMVATPLLAIMRWIAAQPRIMGEFAIGLPLRIGGWVATLILASCVIAMGLTAVMQLGR